MANDIIDLNIQEVMEMHREEKGSYKRIVISEFEEVLLALIPYLILKHFNCLSDDIDSYPYSLEETVKFASNNTICTDWISVSKCENILDSTISYLEKRQFDIIVSDYKKEYVASALRELFKINGLGDIRIDGDYCQFRINANVNALYDYLQKLRDRVSLVRIADDDCQRVHKAEKIYKEYMELLPNSVSLDTTLYDAAISAIIPAIFNDLAVSCVDETDNEDELGSNGPFITATAIINEEYISEIINKSLAKLNIEEGKQYTQNYSGVLNRVISMLEDLFKRQGLTYSISRDAKESSYTIKVDCDAEKLVTMTKSFIRPFKELKARMDYYRLLRNNGLTDNILSALKEMIFIHPFMDWKKNDNPELYTDDNELMSFYMTTIASFDSKGTQLYSNNIPQSDIVTLLSVAGGVTYKIPLPNINKEATIEYLKTIFRYINTVEIEYSDDEVTIIVKSIADLIGAYLREVQWLSNYKEYAEYQKRLSLQYKTSL